jgi:hypothetical protein
MIIPYAPPAPVKAFRIDLSGLKNLIDLEMGIHQPPEGRLSVLTASLFYDGFLTAPPSGAALAQQNPYENPTPDVRRAGGVV